MRSPGRAPAAAARTRPRSGGRRCQAPAPRGNFPPAPSGGVARSPAHLPPEPELLYRPRPRPHPPGFGLPVSSGVPRRRDLAPPPGRPRPRSPPRGLKRLRLGPPPSRARGVGRCWAAEAEASSTPGLSREAQRSAAGALSPSSPRSRSSRRRRPRSAAEPAMALSMPLNGLKEEDKEPVIELFVKVSARPPSRRAEPLASARRAVGGRRPCTPDAPRPPRPRCALARRPPSGREKLISRPRPIVSGPPAPSRRPGRSREPGRDRDPPAAGTRSGGHRLQLRGLWRLPDRRPASRWDAPLPAAPRRGWARHPQPGSRPGARPTAPHPHPRVSPGRGRNLSVGNDEPNFLECFVREHFASRWHETLKFNFRCDLKNFFF